MTEIKESPQGDNEKTIEKLKNENADLRRRIKELQKENSKLRSVSEEKFLVPKVEKKPLKIFKKQKKSEVLDSTKKPKEPKASNVSKVMDLEISSEFETPSVPLSTMHRSIMVGDSRRMCPGCNNANHRLIFEEIDKTHILMDYPRIYGKKYKCGNCGQEWTLPVALE